MKWNKSMFINIFKLFKGDWGAMPCHQEDIWGKSRGFWKKESG